MSKSIHSIINYIFILSQFSILSTLTGLECSLPPLLDFCKIIESRVSVLGQRSITNALRFEKVIVKHKLNIFNCSKSKN
jgi:hypothetical protein